MSNEPANQTELISRFDTPEDRGETFSPVGNKVLVHCVINKEKTTDSGIVYTENNGHEPMKVMVIAVGDEVKEDIRVGDIVLWERVSLGEWNGFQVVEESSILAIWERLEDEAG
tara:strand:- start:1247 stop:1588 length:342 start_codon:yes stop_codon:yes gene_type:complete